jgi:hypothetical protein
VRSGVLRIRTWQGRPYSRNDVDWFSWRALARLSPEALQAIQAEQLAEGGL